MKVENVNDRQMSFSKKFGQSGDSGDSPIFFGFPEEVTEGPFKYRILARAGTRAVYIRVHGPTKKIKGMIVTTGLSTVACDAATLCQVLTSERYASQTESQK